MTDQPFNQPTQPTITEPKPPSIVRRMLGFLGSVLQTIVFAVILFVVVNMLTARIRVEGDSMEPSLVDGQFVVVNKLAYSLQDPQRGDIVVFRFPLNPERRFIKRIIGLPGDHVQVQDGQVFIDGNLLNEPYLAVPPAYNDRWDVGLNEVFVLGDNRNNSSDSQNWGALVLEDIIGKAFLVYWPMDSMGWIPHYDLAASADPG
ncbi:MAG: signal peptidase I [Chloroflexi bacterium]|nr:signal peptidase I [Chloroflexota bacterium]